MVQEMTTNLEDYDDEKLVSINTDTEPLLQDTTKGNSHKTLWRRYGFFAIEINTFIRIDKSKLTQAVQILITVAVATIIWNLDIFEVQCS
jgi:hypothetical protein